jgi:hypothetical protein
MKRQCLRFLLVVEHDLDLAFLSGKPAFEPLWYGKQAFLQAAGGRADCEDLLLSTHTRKTLLLCNNRRWF